MLVFLQHWAQTHRIRLKLFNPRQSVLDKLEQVNAMQDFNIATLDEMVALLAGADSRHACGEREASWFNAQSTNPEQ